MENTAAQPDDLLNGFRQRYQRFVLSLQEAISSQSDSTVIARLGDDLDEYSRLLQYSTVLDSSHHGRPTIIQEVRSGGRGRPRIVIDPDWLAWAYGHRSVKGIARFLHVGRSTVRNALLEYGLAEPQANPFPQQPSLIDQLEPQPVGVVPGEQQFAAIPASIASFTGPLTSFEDGQLDAAIVGLRSHFPRAGVTMLDGMLRGTGVHVSREHIRQSLLRIEPVRRIFERIRIERRVYNVPGPNALWHHDGQHGESVHNVRIERLWVDVTAQVGSKWADFFTNLELVHGLDVNSTSHLWLLHQLFLPRLNAQLSFFAESWNRHKIQICNGPSRTPADMFVMDMYVFGVRGSQIAPEEALSEDDLEVYGVDWEGLGEPSLLTSRNMNNGTNEGHTSWVGRAGPPEHLNTVEVIPPTFLADRAEEVSTYLQAYLQEVLDNPDPASQASAWVYGLAFMQSTFPNYF
ncbi:hypothetical protein BV25DRAFT_1807039 [Artomyces pyxidatus]|uniref:Uncharacterized protein n=1 Tax=Artomyces pyxidatus TaxID=48021 RepID=A0ACB8SWH8_9AGAM|nr:hypothetical protein BV25DRAFT_1807039 [Artomyces pyxidatus]